MGKGREEKEGREEREKEKEGRGKRRGVGADFNRSRGMYSKMCFQFSLIFCVVFRIFCRHYSKGRGVLYFTRGKGEVGGEGGGGGRGAGGVVRMGADRSRSLCMYVVSVLQFA